MSSGQVCHDGAIYSIEDGVFEAPAAVAAGLTGVTAYDPDAAVAQPPVAPPADDKKSRRK